jgi:corrinoid protein of di/trimethylamine methyltransferase
MDIFERMKEAVSSGDVEKAVELAKEAIKKGVNPVVAIEKGLAPGVREVGDRFGRHEAFLTELIMAGSAMKAACDILREAIPKGGARAQKVIGRVVIGTVSGDIHSIGKDIVATMLEASGFEVYNLGEDVPTKVFVEKVETLKPDVLALSTLMTATMPQAKEVLDALEKANLRQRVYVVVGGAPTTREWAQEIGADGWAEDAVAAVSMIKSLLEKKKHRNRVETG